MKATRIDDIDYNKTILRQKMVFKSKVQQRFDTVFFYLLVSVFLFVLISYYISHDTFHAESNLFIYGFIVPINVFVVYSLYRKLTETRLIKIPTQLSKTKAREQLVELTGQWYWERKKNNVNYMQAYSLSGFGRREQIVLIYFDNAVYLNIMSAHQIFRFPILFHQFIVKHDIAKALNNKQVLA